MSKKVGVILNNDYSDSFGDIIGIDVTAPHLVRPLRVDQALVQAIIHKDLDAFIAHLDKVAPDRDEVEFEFDLLRIVWLDPGKRFCIREYDGFELIVSEDDLDQTT